MGRRTFEQILEIVIVIGVKPPHRYRLLRSLKLSLHIPVISTAVRNYPNPTVFPKWPLAAEAVRCLDNGHQHGHADRTQRRNRTEPFPGLVLLALSQEFLPRLFCAREQVRRVACRKARPGGARW